MPPTTGSTRTGASRRLLAVLAAAVAAVGLSACSHLPFGPGSGPSTQTLAGGAGFLVAAPSNGESDVGYSGPLTLVGGNCVGLGSPDDEETSVLAFPAGTRSSEDGRAIVLPDGVRVALGDSITAGGGSTTLRLYPDAFTPWPDAPSGCAGATYLTAIHDVSIGERQ